jgi:hypothetical protein
MWFPSSCVTKVPFLLRHEGDSRAGAALDAIRRRPERLLENERGWLEEQAPEVLTRN